METSWARHSSSFVHRVTLLKSNWTFRGLSICLQFEYLFTVLAFVYSLSICLQFELVCYRWAVIAVSARADALPLSGYKLANLFSIRGYNNNNNKTNKHWQRVVRVVLTEFRDIKRDDIVLFAPVQRWSRSTPETLPVRRRSHDEKEGGASVCKGEGWVLTDSGE